MEQDFFNTEERPDKSVLHLVTGYDHSGNLSIRHTRLMALLGYSSIVMALLFALAACMYLHIHVDALVLSITLGSVVGVVVLLFNRYFFLFYKRRGGGKTVLVVLYITFYALLGYVLVAESMAYLYLQSEIQQIVGERETSAVIRFAAFHKATSHLTLDEQHGLDSFTRTVSGLLVLFSMLPLLIHTRMVNREASSLGLAREHLREELEDELLQKKEEYARIYSRELPKPKWDDPFAEEEEQSQGIEERKALLLSEIRHLEDTIQNVI